MKLDVRIVSAEKMLYQGHADCVIATAAHGEIGILPQHAPFLGQLKPGQVRVKVGNDEQVFFISGGMIEVQPNSVTVLADTAERAADLDEAKAIEAMQAAEAAFENQQADFDYARARAELARAAAQLAAIRRRKSSERG